MASRFRSMMLLYMLISGVGLIESTASPRASGSAGKVAEMKTPELFNLADVRPAGRQGGRQPGRPAGTPHFQHV